jgi:hypothetical protein
MKMAKRHYIPAILVVAAVPAFVALAAARSDSGAPPKATAAKTIKLEDATTIIEVNDTDGDAGLQVFLDGEPWKSMKVSRPGGKRILNVKAKGELNRLGLTELFSESNEPEFKELPLAKFKQRFPEGKYKFKGRTIEGDKLVGSARLSHDTPKGPRITAPAADSMVPDGDVLASWEPVPGPGIELEGYRAIVEREDPFRKFEVDLPASQTSVTIPSEFVEPGTDYKIEVQSIERSGNQTISEIPFRTGQ